MTSASIGGQPTSSSSHPAKFVEPMYSSYKQNNVPDAKTFLLAFALFSPKRQID